MTPPGSRRNFFTGISGLPFAYPEVSVALPRIRLGTSLPVAERNAGLFRADAALRELLTLGYPRLSPTLENNPTPEQMETAVQGLLAAARQGNRLAFLDAMRGTYVLLHRQLDNPAAHADIPRIVRLFSDLSEEYARYIADRPEFTPLQRLTYLFAAAKVTRMFYGRFRAAAEHETAWSGETVALRGILRRLHVSLENYHGEMRGADPTGDPLEGIRLEIQMRRALLEDDPARARSRARELVAYLNLHPPLPEDESNPESLRFYQVAARELLEDPEFNRLVAELDAPSTAEQEGEVLNGLSLELVAVAAATLDQIDEIPELEIRGRYQALSAVTTVLTLAMPGLSLRQILAALRDPARESELLAGLRRWEEGGSELAAFLRQAVGSGSLEGLLRQARGTAAHVESLRQGPGASVLEALLAENERHHPVVRLARALAGQESLLRGLNLAGDDARAALELLRRGSEGTDQLRAYAAANPGFALDRYLRLLEPPEGAPSSLDAFGGALVESFQDGLNSRPDHEAAMLQALAATLAQGQEVAPDLRLGATVTAAARRLTERLEGFEFRALRVARHFFAPTSLATLGIGILSAELAPAFLIARAGASGRVAAPLLGELVSAGNLTARGAALTGLGTGFGMAAFGAGLNNLHQARLGFRTHFWRDLAVHGAINSLTFGSTMLFARAMNRWVRPDLGRGFAVGEANAGRGLLLHGGNAVFGTLVGMGLGITARGLQTGHWTSSWDEVAENFATLLGWEFGAAGLRGLRRHAGLNPELGLPEAGRIARLWNRIPVLRRPTVLGAHRATRVTEVADRLIQATPALASERPFLLRQLGLQEAHAPGSLEIFTEEFFRQYRPRLAGEGEGQRLLMVRRTRSAAATGAVEPPAVEAPEAGPPPVRDTDAEAPAAPHSVVPPPPTSGQRLERGVSILIAQDNAPNLPRRGEHFVVAEGVGEVSVFTHEGISKHRPARNEDGYGMVLAPDGALIAMVADGAGGSGAGDRASTRALQIILARMAAGEGNLGEAFLAAHHAIRQEGHGGYTVATGIRINAEGQVEVATVGDSQLLVARPRGDGSFEIIRPYFPCNTPGMIRAGGREVGNTLEMNSHPNASTVFGALGTGNLTVRNQLNRMGSGHYYPEGIFHAALTLPEHADGRGEHRAFRAEPGDVFLMMSDGVHELFTREQMAETIRGLRGADEIRNALQRETEARLEIHRLSRTPGSMEERREVPYGGLRGAFVDGAGDVYDAATGGSRIGHVGPDNVVLMAVRYEPSLRAASRPTGDGSDRAGATPAASSEPASTVAGTLEVSGSEGATENPQPRNAESVSEDPAMVPAGVEAGLALSTEARPTRPPLPELRERVQSGVRAQIIQASQARTHRDSPFVARLNTVEVEIAIDPSSGEVVAAEAADPRRHILRTRVVAEADQNTILLDMEAIQAFQREMDDWNISEEDFWPVANVLSGLMSLHRQPIVPRPAPAEVHPELAERAGTGAVEVLPAIAPNILAEMRGNLRHMIGQLREGAMTSMLSGALSWDFNPTDLYVGELTLGPNGEILATNLGRPDFASPRGTRYRTGVALGGEQIDVVVDRAGNIFHYEPLDALNARQEAALAAYTHSGENQAGLRALQERAPYALDLILRRDPGALLHHINFFVSRAENNQTRLTLRRGENGYEVDELMDGGGIAEFDIGLVREGDSLGLRYRLVSGILPAEILTMLEHLQNSTGRSMSSGVAEIFSRAALPALPAEHRPLYTFHLENLREGDFGHEWNLGALLIASGQRELIHQLGSLREVTLTPHVGGSPFSYRLVSRGPTLLIHRSYDPMPLRVPRGEPEILVLRPGDSATVSEFFDSENRLGDLSVAFLHQRPTADEH